MSLVTNPTTFTIVDLNVTPENVTNFFVDLGTAPGQYTVHNEVTVASLTFDAAKNSYTGTFASLTNKPNTSGQWYIAGRAVNAVGTSSESPESSFMILLPRVLHQLLLSPDLFIAEMAQAKVPLVQILWVLNA